MPIQAAHIRLSSVREAVLRVLAAESPDLAWSLAELAILVFRPAHRYDPDAQAPVDDRLILAEALACLASEGRVRALEPPSMPGTAYYALTLRGRQRRSGSDAFVVHRFDQGSES